MYNFISYIDNTVGIHDPEHTKINIDISNNTGLIISTSYFCNVNDLIIKRYLVNFFLYVLSGIECSAIITKTCIDLMTLEYKNELLIIDLIHVKISIPLFPETKNQQIENIRRTFIDTAYS